jgi:DNA integrity scanning protein DisA with diadenylate cyclase activity
MPTREESRRENVESKRLVESAFELARSLDIAKVLVHADELRDIRFIEKLRGTEQVIWVTRGGTDLPLSKRSKDRLLAIPDTALTRMSQLKIGLLLSVLHEYVALDETLLCLSGVAGSQRVDTLLITNPQRDFPWFRERDVRQTQNAIATREFVAVLAVAVRLSREGREGSPIGAIFVLGDEDQLSPYLCQLILNPCQGHPQKNRNIHDEAFLETLREFAALDGAFVVNNRGVVESAGTYIDAPATKAKLRTGLGARHAAAAAITAATEAIAVVVSESSGAVTVFHGGEEILELEQTRSGLGREGAERKRTARRSRNRR